MKSMAELQAQIALEGNSIAVLKQQSDNLEYIQKAKKDIIVKQEKERNSNRHLNAIKNSLKKNHNKDNGNKFSNLLN